MSSLNIFLIVLVVVIAIVIVIQANSDRNVSSKIISQKIINKKTTSIIDESSVAARQEFLSQWVQYLFYIKQTAVAIMDADQDADVLMTRLRTSHYDMERSLEKIFQDKEISKAIGRYIKRYTEQWIIVAQTMRIDSNYNKHIILHDIRKTAEDFGMYLDLVMGTEYYRMKVIKLTEQIITNFNSYAANNYQDNVRSFDSYINNGCTLALSILF